MDNSLIINQWDSISASSIGIIRLTQLVNAELLLAVKGSSGSAVQFQWTSLPNLNNLVIPSTALMQSYHVIGSPFVLIVAPSAFWPATSRISGQAITLSTAGIRVSFRVQVSRFGIIGFVIYNC